MPALAVARPVRQQEGRRSGVADRAYVGAAVAETHDRGFVHQHLTDHFEVALGVVLEGVRQQSLAVLRHHRFERNRPGAAAFGLRARGDAVRRVAVRSRRHRPRRRFSAAPLRSCACARRGAFLYQNAPQLRIALQTCVTLGRRQVVHRGPRRVRENGWVDVSRPHHHADRPAADLAVHVRRRLCARHGSARASRATARVHCSPAAAAARAAGPQPRQRRAASRTRPGRNRS